MARNKVTVIGAGNVGATTAQRIAEAGRADAGLVDIIDGLPQGKGLDQYQSGPIEGFDARISGTALDSLSSGAKVPKALARRQSNLRRSSA